MPTPSRGLVVHLAYLWAREQRAAAIEGRKDRPCVIVEVEGPPDGSAVVGVCPITHSPIGSLLEGVELPRTVKRHLGLDEAQSWIIATELNRFTWPGFDLRRTPDGREVYGELPERLLTVVVRLLKRHAREGALSQVDRDD